MSHTPTPWSIKTSQDYMELEEEEEIRVYGILGPGPREVNIVSTDSGYYGPSLDDAKFIVKAVNSHQAMKEALELTLATMDRLEAKYGPFLSVQGTRDVANKALTLANGGPSDE